MILPTNLLGRSRPCAVATRQVVRQITLKDMQSAILAFPSPDSNVNILILSTASAARSINCLEVVMRLPAIQRLVNRQAGCNRALDFLQTCSALVYFSCGLLRRGKNLNQIWLFLLIPLTLILSPNFPLKLRILIKERKGILHIS